MFHGRRMDWKILLKESLSSAILMTGCNDHAKFAVLRRSNIAFPGTR